MLRRSLAAAVAIAAAVCLAPAPAFAGWTCSYYKWHGTEGRYVLVGKMVDQDQFEFAHGRNPGGYWDCRYCLIPAIPPRPPEQIGTIAEPLVHAVDDALPRDVEEIDPVSSIGVPVWPFGGIEGCPATPPRDAFV